MRVATSLLKASGIAALVFAFAWIRLPITVSTISSTAVAIVFFGGIFAVLSFVIGLPLVIVMEKLRIGRWWSYTLIAAVTGALLATAVGHRPTGGLENAHGGMVFSPLTRDRPEIDSYPTSSAEYFDSILFCAIVGGILGLAFWYFSLRSQRPNKTMEPTR